MGPLERHLLDEFQRDFPLVARPFAAIAERVGATEAEVIETLAELRRAGAVGRIGATVRPHTVGASTLAAIAVPEDRLEDVADLVGAYDEVNHNYAREHRWNLWFVVTAPDRARVDAVLAEIGARTGLPVLDLPMLEDYRLDLGFRLAWT